MAHGVAHRVTDRETPSCRLLIAGQWIDGENPVEISDKFTLQPFARAFLPSREQVRACVAAADAAFRADALDAHERGAILERTAAQIE